MRLTCGTKLRATAASAVLAAVVVGAGSAALTGSAVAAATTPQACRPAVSTPTRVGRYLGIVLPRPIATGEGSGSGCATRQPTAGSSGSSGTSNESSSYSGTPPLIYGGGPIMATPSVGDKLTLTPIFWGPNNSFSSSYESVINQFITDAAHDSGLSTNVFSVLTQYTDSSSNHVHYDMVAGTPITDTNGFPANGCTPDSGAVYSDSSGYTSCLTDAQLQSQIKTEATAHSLPSDYGHIYALFLPKGVESCFTSADGAHGGTCTINSHAATAGGYCAYHSSFGTGPSVYAAMPFPVYESPTGYTCGQDAGPGLQNLNGNTDADVEVSPLSHETSEAMTDPLGNAWVDSSGNEIGDDCAYIYGSLSGASGTEYNQTINGHHYLLQEEFSNEDYVANSAGCIQSEELPTAAIGANPTNPTVGQTVTFSGAGSSDDDHTGGGISSYSWNFGDGSTATTSAASTTHSYSSSGTYHATLQVTDVDGWVSTAASVTVTVGSAPSVSAISPSSVAQGTTQPASVTGSNFESGATVSVSGTGVSLSNVSVTATSISLTLSVAAGAVTGARNVTVTNPDGGTASCTSCLTVDASPVASKVSPATFVTGTTAAAQISGTGFQAGAVVSVSGSGVSDTVGTVTSTSLSITVTVASGASSGSRSITVTNPDGGSYTCSSCLTIDFPPATTGVTPGTFVTGTSTAAQLNGSNFQSGASVSVSGSGVTAAVGSVTPTAISLTVAVASGAGTGPHDVTITNPDGGTSTCSGCLVVDAAPTVGKVAPSYAATNTASPATITGSNFQNGATVAISGTGVTATVNNVSSGSISVTVTVSSTASAGSRDVTVTNPDGGTTTCSGCIVVVLQQITNGTFETGNLSGWATAGTAGVTTSAPHSGSYSALLGATTATAGDSSISQTFGLPAKDSSLTFWYETTCAGTVTNDWVTATITNDTTGTSATALAKTCPTAPSWRQVKLWTIPSDVYTLTVTNHDDGTNVTNTKVDDVKLVAAPVLTNGGFEKGTLTGWTHSGTASVTTSGPHSGTYAALLGAATPTNGASSLVQTFTVPAGSSTLSFWYDVTCPDTVTHDWATATLKDLNTGSTLTVLPKTCVGSSGWVEVTTPITAGYSYTLTLTNRDDDNAANPTFTKYDDVALT